MKFLLIIHLVSLFLYFKEGTGKNEYIIELQTRHLEIPVAFSEHVQDDYAFSSFIGPTIPLQSTITKNKVSLGNYTLRGRSMQGVPSSGNQTGKEVEEDVPHMKINSNGVVARISAQVNIRGKFVGEPSSTHAEHGDGCDPNDALEWDYCERAEYPNKGRMVCATQDAEQDLEKVGRCVCKFVKIGEKWTRMRYDSVSKICLSPSGGRCYVKFPDHETSTQQLRVYIKSIERAHEQCDDPEPFNSTKRTLVCSKANPRRFSNFNAFHYYCLAKIDRSSAKVLRQSTNLLTYLILNTLILQQVN